MLITCPSCGGGFELADVAVKATATCPLCRRVVVVRDAQAVPPGREEATVPFDASTDAALEPLVEEQTAVAYRGAGLALPAGKRISLAFLSGPRSGDVFPLAKPRVTLGRAGGGADLEVDDPEMSRAHAAIEVRGARVLLLDTGSRNGTYVAERKIDARELSDREEFRVGRTRLLLTITDRD